jgi:hypothetical protein
MGFQVTLITNFKYFNYFCYVIVMCFGHLIKLL